jgi:tetratricopeptide (TPR) repeat protein
VSRVLAHQPSIGAADPMRRQRSVPHAEESSRCRSFARLCVTLAGCASLLAASAYAEDPPGTPTSREALATCHQARSDARADELLEKSLALADQAVAADDKDALAYFARFCALGEQARRSGVSISSLVKIWGIRDAVDRTLALAPEFPDALFGKGALLVSLPGILGGDTKAGDRLIARALEIDPDYVEARLFRADALEKNGQREAAQEEARRALASAERKHDQEGIAAAQAVLSGSGERER